MENKKNTILLIIMIFINVSCDIMDKKTIRVYNISKDTIFCVCTTEDHFKYYPNSPLNVSIKITDKDTTWTQNNNLIFPKDSINFRSYNWENTFKNTDSKKIYVFFFKYSTLKKRTWEELKQNSFCDKKVSLSLEDLDVTNWRLVYNDRLP